MDGKILGIPTALLVLILGVTILVDLPLVALNTVTQKRIARVEQNQAVQSMQLQRVQSGVLNLTASQAATITPTVSPKVETPKGVMQPTSRVANPTPGK